MWRTGIVAGILGVLVAVTAASDTSFRTLAELPLNALENHPGTEIVLGGRNTGTRAATLILRIDDIHSRNYAGRFNDERLLPPGAFTLHLPLSGLRTPSGRTLDPDGLKHFVAFTADSGTPIVIDTHDIAPPPETPPGVLALDFGPQDGPVMLGFRQIDVTSPILTCARCAEIFRPYPDPLIADGIQGATRITLPAPPGPSVLALWTEDTGEWEYLPHFRERRIKVNNRTVLHEKWQSRKWIGERYLAGLNRDFRPGQTAWQALGQWRGGLIVTDVEPEDGTVVIDLAGEGYSATHIAALMLVPRALSHEIDAVQDRRAARFNETWPILERIPRISEAGPRIDPLSVSPITIRRGTVAAAEFRVAAPPNGGDVAVHIDPPEAGGQTVTANLYVAKPRLARPSPSAKALVVRGDFLDGRSNHIRLMPGIPRRLVIVLRAADDQSSGVYTGKLRVTGKGWSREAGLTVEVADHDPAPTPRFMGTYLEPFPPDIWFGGFAQERIACAMDRLAEFGITAIAPPLALPTDSGAKTFLTDLEQAARRFPGPVLSYTTVKRLTAYEGVEAMARRIGRLEAEIRRRGLRSPIWSIADEPSDAGRTQRVRELAASLRHHAPTARLAGHLNHPNNMSLVELFDVVLLNEGFGLTRNRIETIRRQGKEVWLYNLPDPRQAGQEVLRLGAAGYFQWHGAMPTAAPFDPTDGREDDFFLVYPEDNPCPSAGVIDERLLELSQAAADVRYQPAGR